MDPREEGTRLRGRRRRLNANGEAPFIQNNCQSGLRLKAYGLRLFALQSIRLPPKHLYCLQEEPVKRLLWTCVALFAVVAMTTEMYADQKVKKRMSFGQQSFDTTTYIKGQRSRDEMNFGQFQMVTIHQCDAGQDISVNDRTKTYMVTKTGANGARSAAMGAGAKGMPEEMEFDPPVPPGGKKGGTVTISTSIQDTGERKDFFGYEARHLKATMQMKSSPDACDPNKSMNMSTDGWYINFKEKMQFCERPMVGGGDNSPMRRSEASCVDKIKMTGAGVTSMFGGQGYPVDVTTSMTDEKGKVTSFRQQALEISSATLDAGLFDAPSGYRQASSYMDMMGMGGGMGAMMGSRGRSTTSRAPSRTPEATPEARGRNRTPEVRGSRRMVGTREIGPKQPGKMRVCAVAFNDKSGKMTDADNLRRQLMDGIEHYGYETIPIDSQSQSAAMRDAKDFDCDYVVFNDMTPKTSGAQTAKKIGGFMGRSLGGLTGNAADRATADANYFNGTLDFQLFKVATPDNPSLTGTNEAQGRDGGKQAMDKESKDVAKQVAKGK